SEQLSAPPLSVAHTLGMRNQPANTEWDYIPFLDRDFTSLAEVLLVPRSPPGLFTKQFAEQGPPAPPRTPGAPFVTPPPSRPDPPRALPGNTPQTHRYLADEFYYSGAPEVGPPQVGGVGGAGWHKMLEFLEVPSHSRGATGRVAEGMNFDAAR